MLDKRPTSHPRRGSERPRRALDAVHREPGVQEEPAAARRRQGHALLHRDGRKIIDGASGMWCTNAGHGRTEISSAIAKRRGAGLCAAVPDRHSAGLRTRQPHRGTALAGLDHVFFCNSGSEAADTALKIALAYQQINGQGSRIRLIGRERGYHGVGFGGTSVGGIVGKRKLFGSLMTGVDHLPATYDREKQAFSKGEPEYGAHFADELERIVNLHGANTVAAVIVEPMAGSTGVLSAQRAISAAARDHPEARHPPDLRRVHHRPGRLGLAVAAERYGVTPDMLTFAKGITMARPDGRRAGARHHP